MTDVARERQVVVPIEVVFNSSEAEALVTACRVLDLESPGRKRPSPSSVMRCRRQSWLQHHDYPQSDWPDGESYIARETGRVSEPILARLIEKAGLGKIIVQTEVEREFHPAELKRMSLRGGQHDALLETPDGDITLVEYKRKNAYAYLNIWEKGIAQAAPDDYVQMQVMLKAKGLSRCLYIAASFSRAELTREARYRKLEPRPSGLFAEWVPLSSRAAFLAKKRAEEMIYLQDNVNHPSLVPRDYEPVGPRGGGGDMKCEWCPVRSHCIEAIELEDPDDREKAKRKAASKRKAARSARG